MTDRLSENVSELGYPTSEMESLLKGAQQQYLQQVEAHGPGRTGFRTKLAGISGRRVMNSSRQGITLIAVTTSSRAITSVTH